MAKPVKFVVDFRQKGWRMDKALAALLPNFSRSALQKLIREGHVLRNGVPTPSHRKVREGEILEVQIPDAVPWKFTPQKMDLRILYEDRDLIVVDKPADVVVHPAPGSMEGTLAHGLLAHCRNLSSIGGVYRPGIVHRLDKGTSGCLIVAKTDAAHRHLTEQFKERTVKKTYLCVVEGEWREGAKKILTDIGRNPTQRKKMMVRRAGTGRQSLTWVKPLKVFDSFSLLEVHLQTGRTHQIRVHLSYMRHPVLGDTLYGRGRKMRTLPFPVTRPLLHAWQIEFQHPILEKKMNFVAPIPKDMAQVIQYLEEEN